LTDFRTKIGVVQRMKEEMVGLASKFMQLDEYMRGDNEKVKALFGNQSAGSQLVIVLEDVSQTLKTASAEIAHFGTIADKMTNALSGR
jgi:hypothetical protein